MRISTTIMITFIALFINGCRTSSLLSKGTSKYGKIRFYVEREREQPSNVKKVYAEVDSSGIKMYYSFYPNRLLKVKENENLVFTGETSSGKGIIYQDISRLDSAVLVKAVQILNSLQLNWRRPDSIVAFIPEVLYYHGQPNNYKLKPL